MSFLVRRNLPKAWAGFRDTFDRPPQNPLQPPWRHLGGGESSINNIEELVITQQIVNDDGRGPSYTYMPFTDCWGFETEVWYPVEGVDNQIFMMGFTNTWANVSSAFTNVFGVWLYHDLGGADLIQTGEVPQMWAAIERRQSWPSPVGAFQGQTLTVRLWCEADEWVRIWLNGIFVGAAMISPAYKLGPGRRCMRFMNRSYCNVWVRWVHHYDRPPSTPRPTSPAAWASSFYDDFNRADSNTVGNGWTKLDDTRSGIWANSWSTNTTDDGQRAILRDTGITSTRMRIEGTVGGAVGVNSAQDSGLILYSNSVATQGLSANIFSGKVYISRFSGSVGNFTDISALTSGVTVNNGDLVAFTVWDGTAWIEINGTRVLYADNVHFVVPSTNTHAGLRTKRAAFNTSHSWNDVRILTAV